MSDLFARTAREIIDEAVVRYSPVAIFAGFSGGDDSLVLCHWMMNNVPGTRLFFINTGVGCRRSREFVWETQARYGWPLIELRALEDCGQDYDEIVRKFGFPGPFGHQLMYRRLKERAIEKLVRDTKTRWRDKVLLATGVREDESIRRMGYKGREINRNGAQVWVNAIYWWSKAQRDDYLMHNQIIRNPVSRELGISGECMCGAFAQPGEHERLRAVDPELAARFDRLHAEIKHRFPWCWEDRPPRKSKSTNLPNVGPLCIGCEKSAIVQSELQL